MTNEAKPIVRLWELHNLGLIVCHPSGVIYSNQVGGYATHHPEMEGSFVPLQEHDLEFDQQAALEAHFTGPKWRGHCYRGIDEETADFVDDVLGRSTVTARLKVNREKLLQCEEAWIHVSIGPDDPSGYSLFERFGSDVGVLTWENSD